MKYLGLILTLLVSLSSNAFAQLKGIGKSYSTISIIKVNKEKLLKVLPEGIELNNQELTDSEHHPIIINYNIQEDVRFSLNEFNVQFFKKYNEVIVAIPFTKPINIKEKKNFTYLKKLHLDSLPPVLLGKAYGMNKVMADIAESDGQFSVADLGQILLKTNFEVTEKPESFNTALLKLKAILKDPIFNLRKSFPFSKPKAICANFNWNIKVEKSWALNQRLIFGGYYEELTDEPVIQTNGLAENLINSSVLMENDWDISPPLNCITGRIDLPGPL